MTAHTDPEDHTVTTPDLDAIRARAEAATPGPWWFDEDDDVWRLHGVHARIPADPIGIPEQVINHQILKAPKRGTRYAEYWPGAADADFIRHARGDIPALLAEIDRLRADAGGREHQAEEQWVCQPCGYHNVGGICTHCGWVRPSEDAPSARTISPQSDQNRPAVGRDTPVGAEAISGRFEIEGQEFRNVRGLTVHCTRCNAWTAVYDNPADLAELVRRAGEHTEVCR